MVKIHRARLSIQAKPSTCLPPLLTATGCQDQRMQVLLLLSCEPSRKSPFHLKQKGKSSKTIVRLNRKGRWSVHWVQAAVPFVPISGTVLRPSITSPKSSKYEREKGLRFYEVTSVLQKWAELMGFATFSAKSQEFRIITLKLIPHFWKDFH